MIIKPFNDFVLVEIIKEANVTASGIHLPDKKDSEVDQLLIVLAKVRAVGLGRMLADGIRNKMDIEVGDIAEFSGGAPMFSYKGSELAEIDPTLANCQMINIAHLHAVIVLEGDEKFRTDAEDAEKAKREYDFRTQVAGVIG